MKKKTAYLGLLCAAAIILGYVESLFPVFVGVPGMKIGLPNLAVVMVLYLYSWKEAIAVSFVRILVIGFLFGNAFSIAFSLAGGMLSLLCMEAVRRFLKLSCTGVSMIGGVTHNLGQILVAMVVVENVRVGYYFSILAVTGLVTGILIGILAAELVKRIRRAVGSEFDNKRESGRKS
ncbi:MAG: Gx transporter family protein [Oliverpabstia sp.]|nr:Gx transporter family protein [Lachnospiraceae bacterium]MDY5025912.1 Gx transporter family protein [Oliverpabstia sp.]